MEPVLAGAAIFVATAVATSLLMALPATALAETAGEFDAAGRARAWLAALILPPLVGLAAALYALWLHAEGPVASPHIGGLRPHLCLIPVLQAPAGAFVLRAFAWLSLLLVCAGGLRLIASTISSHLLRRMMVTSGAPLDEAPGNALLVNLTRPVSFTAGLLRPVIVISESLRRTLDPVQLRAIVTHETAHARRRDNLRWLLAEVCATLQALTPTAWYYRHRLREALEAAADDAALVAGVPVEALQSALAVASEASGARPMSPSLAALLIPLPALMDRRRERLERLDPESLTAARRPWRGLIAAAVGIALIALLLIVARRAVDDTLYCAFEQLVAALG